MASKSLPKRAGASVGRGVTNTLSLIPEVVSALIGVAIAVIDTALAVVQKAKYALIAVRERLDELQDYLETRFS